MAISEGALAQCGDIPFWIISGNADVENKTCIYGNGTSIMIQDISFYKKFGLTSNILGISALKIPMYYYFRMTYYTTLVACGSGIASFLETGPTRILPKDGWKCYGGYGLAVVVVIYSLYTKALGIGSDGTTMQIVLDLLGTDCDNSDPSEKYLIKLLINPIIIEISFFF